MDPLHRPLPLSFSRPRLLAWVTTCSLGLAAVAHAQPAPAQSYPIPESYPAPLPAEPGNLPEPLPEATDDAPVHEPDPYAVPEPPPQPPTAQPIPCPADRAPVAEPLPAHVIHGHALIPSLLVEYPVVSTYFGSTTGFGTSNLQSLDQDSNALSVKLATFAQGFQGGVAITDWLGLHIEAQGWMLIGTDQDSALIFGAQGRADFSGGVTARLLHGRDFVLSAGFSAGFGAGSTLSPFTAIMAALDEGAINQDVLLTDVSSWQIHPSLAFAFVPTSVVGLQASLGLIRAAETYEDSEPTRTTSVELGLGIDLDGRDVFAPIAAQIAYGMSAETQEGGETGHQLQLGLFYSGRPNLRLGASYLTNLASDTLKTRVGMIQMHYFW